ncbi:MAG: hypothetical protein M5U28_04970 [Sandaracinaceae bacterium]|nr:hypothetical protein [Sandaracinaceae bacterium]
MLDQLVGQFMSSPQGQTAFTRLGAQGFQPQQAQAFLGAAVPAAAQSFLSAQRGGMAGARPAGPAGVLDVGNSHYVTNFLSGAVSGLIRGQGLAGAAVDGLQGVAGGHVAQVIASRFGLPQRVAGTVGAIVTPLVIDWLWERVNGGGLDLGALFGGQPQGQPQGPGAMAGPPAPQPFGVGAPSVTAHGAVSPTVQGGLGALFGNLFNR